MDMILFGLLVALIFLVIAYIAFEIWERNKAREFREFLIQAKKLKIVGKAVEKGWLPDKNDPKDLIEF